ncbi:tetratricopeptide repeat protein [Helicobacter felis]|uniref:tetratricopeptide repeat protein n=1 Tax=Helicobacter felis TaxID=214 RepID=UPI000CF019FF|nr:tetratricopeptide repeat protein [Helicobacter felis]
MKFSKSCSLILSGCLLAPLFSGCLGELFGNSKSQAMLAQHPQKQQQERKQVAENNLQQKMREERSRQEYEAALKRLKYKEYGAALAGFQRAAEAGNADALVALGDMYFNAQGVKEDNVKALDYYTQAANKKVAAAYGKLADMYASALGTKQDSKKALEYANLAIQGKYMLAHLILASMYINGISVPEDGNKAREHFTLACKANIKQACQILDEIGQ